MTRIELSVLFAPPPSGGVTGTSNGGPAIRHPDADNVQRSQG
jgi:hypothetical protein